MASKTTESVVEVYRHLAQIPSVVSGHLSRGDQTDIVRVTSSWTQRDLERSEKIVSRRFDVLKVGQTTEVLATSHQQEVANELYNVPSPCGELTAIVRKVKNKKGDEKRFIEIWKGNSKWKNIDAESLERHGKIYESDDQFGVLRWSNTSDKIVYVAEKKQPKNKSYFEKKSTSSGEKDGDDVKVGEEYLLREDWGEQLVEKYEPVICVLDVESEEMTVVSVDDHHSCGTPVWTTDGSGIIFAAWDQEPYRLGLCFCPMRKSGIYHHDLKAGTTKRLSGDEVGVSSPVLTPGGDHVMWVQTKEGGPHMQTCKLMKCELSGGAVVCVVDIVDTYIPASDDKAFPGWCRMRLPERCWSSDGRLIADNPWRFNDEIVAVNIQTGHVTKLTNDSGCWAWSMLDVHDDLILASRSSPVQTPQLLLGRLHGDQVTWTVLSDGRALTDVRYKLQVHTIPPDSLNPKFPSVTEFESLLVTPADISSAHKTPLILNPHGGPHGRFSGSFMTFITGYVRCGFSVLLVNYRATSGYGQHFIWSLPGNMGLYDVKDCMQALNDTLKSGCFDERKLCVTGGSYGGFLTGELIGVFPDTFKAAVARNPALNMTSMYFTSDIPDWLHVECLGKPDGKFDFKYLPTVDDYSTFQKVSPLRNIHQIKTPLMLMVGLVDIRVPHYQSEEFYHHLRARGVPTRLHRYPESNHPLQEVAVEADNFVNMVLWFSSHM